MYQLTTVRFVVISFAFIAYLASFGQAQTDDIDLSKEIMKQLTCYCGCRLPANSCEGNMTCGESKKLHSEVNQLLSDGKDKDAVLDALVARYGETILAAPTTKGFNLTAWTFPFLALLVGAFVVFRVIRKLSKKSPQTIEINGTTQTKESADGHAHLDEKVEKELREFDE